MTLHLTVLQTTEAKAATYSAALTHSLRERRASGQTQTISDLPVCSASQTRATMPPLQQVAMQLPDVALGSS